MNPREWYEKGMQDLRDGNGSVEYFQEGLNKGKKFHAWARLGIGACHMMSENYTVASIEFEKACELDPKNSISWYELGRAKHKSKTIAPARDCFLQATVLDPKYVDAWIYLGRTWKELGEYQKAVDIFNRVLELDSRNVVALLELANSYLRLKDYLHAIQYTELYLQHKPENDSAWSYLGIARFCLNDFAGAEQAYRKALELNSNNANALFNLGGLYLKQGRVPEATKVFEETLLKDAREIEAWHSLGNIYDDAGRSGEAAYCWRWVFRLEDNPKYKAVTEPHGWPEGIVVVKPQFLRGSEPGHWYDLLELAGGKQGNHKQFESECKVITELDKEDKYKRFFELPVMIEKQLLTYEPNTAIWEEALATRDPVPPRLVMTHVLGEYLARLKAYSLRTLTSGLSLAGPQATTLIWRYARQSLWNIAKQYLPVIGWIVTGNTKEEWEQALTNIGNSSGEAEAFRNKVVLARRHLLQLADAYWDFDANELLQPILTWFEKVAS